MTQLQNVEDFGLFTGARQYDNFWRIKDLMATTRMAPSSKPISWPRGTQIELPESYTHGGEAKSVARLLEDTDTVALLVLKDGMVRHEQYRLTGGPDVQWVSMSVAKSFMSALVGIAAAEGHISSIDRAISDYVPVEPGSAYDGVSIRHVLQMSSGARWNEDYSDPESDIAKLFAAHTGEGLDRFVANMVRETDPGSVCRYNSGETQVLGSLIVHATGRTVPDYMFEKLIEPLGFQDASYFQKDAQGMEQCYAGLNLSARDFARIGELFRNGGRWEGVQIVPAAWVKDSVTVDSPIREAGNPIVGGHAFDLGYGYQWWIPAGDRGEFAAIGVYNQYVFVDPTAGVTIVKLSANPRYGLSEDDADLKDIETVSFLQAIARSF